MSGGAIDIEEFEEADAEELAERSATERIVVFLDANDDRAWKAATIADRLGLDADAVSAILSRLKDRDLVRHKRPYWAITDDADRLRAAYQLHRLHEGAAERYGPEDLETLRPDDAEAVE